MTKIKIIGPAPGEEGDRTGAPFVGPAGRLLKRIIRGMRGGRMDYEAWEKERQELWDKYKPHYLQAQDGVSSANIFVFEHCILERRLCDKGRGVAELTEDQEATIADLDAYAVNIMENLYQEVSVPFNFRPGEVVCRRCGQNKRGHKVFITLPALGLILHDEFCNTCK